MSRFSSSRAGFIFPHHSAPSVIQWIAAALAARRSRAQLGNLNADQLSDIGISETAANSETNRPIWDVPSHWIQ